MNYLYLVTAIKLHPTLRAQKIRLLTAGAVLMLLMFSSVLLFAQDQSKAQTPPPPLPTREVSGIVKDSTDLGVIGATVSLTSKQDTLKVSTNNDGIFVFKNVKSATYTIVVQSIGYVKTPPMRFKQNDLTPRIVMDPIILKEEHNTLNEVVINGTPSITYKTDTVEYKASDYVVRANATVDELLKKMEGMEVGTDGSLVHQGEAVTKAKLNGKEYLGGDIANAIKNLPAEIVDKIQIVDDYGDEAARTGIKDGDPEKILNITTRTDKSVGNMINLRAAAGNNDRYEAGVFGTRINGNQQVGVNANYRNTVNGVAGGGGDDGGGRGQGGGGGGGNSGGSGGTTSSGNGSFSIRDKVGKKIEYNINYGYSGTGVNSISETESLNNSTIGKTTTIASRTGDNDTRNHNFRLETEINLDSNNFLKITPSIRYSSTSSFDHSVSYQTGIQHQLRDSKNTSTNTRPQLGGSVFYQHLFDKPRRNLSFVAELNTNDQTAETHQDQNIKYYLDSAETQIKDSLINRMVTRKNFQNNYRGSLTYVEPLGTNTQLEFNSQINYNGYNNDATTRNITPDGFSKVIDSLSKIYDYSFTQSRTSLNFRYGMSNTSRVRFSAGITGIPALLLGTKASLGTSIRRTSFNLIPIARFEYLWSRQHRISLDYSGRADEPTFDQIQPVRDVSNPQNPVIGNPNLLATFTHSINGRYNNYIANSKLNYSLNANASFTKNSVIRNRVDVRDFSIPEDTVYITETRFINMSGVYRVGGNYNISKQLNDRKYNLQLNGSVNYSHNLSMSNNQENVNTVTTFNQRFGPRINPTEWFEINPHVSYNYTKSTNTLSRFVDNEISTLAFNLDGRVYLWETWLFGYSASKNYVSGISANVNSNPLVVNAYIEKELFNRRGRVTFQAFDIFNQNNFINRDYSDDGGYVDTKSNALSRYFMVRLSMRLQKWTGAKGRGGRGVMRRGDGSFM